MKKKITKKGGPPLARIKDEVLDYYRNINRQLEDGFGDDAQRELFLGNVFEQLSKDICDVSRHQNTSFCIQKLITYSTADQLINVFKELLKKFDSVMVDRSASYVLQTVLYKSSEFISGDEDNPFVQMLHQLGMKLLERTELLSNNNASHIVRSLVEVMAGVQVDSKIVSGKHAKRDKTDAPLTTHDQFSEFEELLKTLSDMVLPSSLKSFDLLHTPHTAGLAETFLIIFREKQPSLCKRFCSRMLKSGCFKVLGNDCNLPKLLTGQTSSYFICVLCEVMNKKQFSIFLKDIILPSINEFVMHPTANYVVQSVIANVHTSKQLSKVMDAIGSNLVDLMTRDRSGVVLNLVKAVLKFTDQQPNFLELLKTQLDWSEGNGRAFFLSLATLKSANHGGKKPDEDKVIERLRYVNYLQSMIIQCLFEFQNCEDICSGLMDLNYKELVCLATSKTLSYVFNAFMNSTTIQTKKKKELAEKLVPIYSTIVKDMFGSRVFDAFWDVMSIPCKEKTLDELGKQEAAIMGNKYSKFIGYKTHLSDYVHRRSEWKTWAVKENKAKKRSISTAKLNEEEEPLDISPKKKKKKKVKQEEAMC